jgi:protein SCO1/2
MMSGLGEAAAASTSRIVRDQDGRPFAIASLRGREVAVFFGYTHCPDVCPTVLATLALVQRRLPPGARFQVVFVTVDPARDSPARVKRFVEAFDPHFIGVTGDPAALDPLYRSFKIWSAKVPNPDGAGYLLAHESGIALLDARGAVRTTLPWNASTDTIAAAVKALLP